MKTTCIIFVLFLSINLSFGQSLTVFDVDASNFPTIKARFYAFAQDGKQITNLNPSDFELKENGQPRTVTYVSCPPPQPPLALSSVLVFDVSGSMSDGPPRIQSAKDAANSWINGLPLGKSECALVAFDDKSNIVQDFTTSRDKLKVAVNKLSPSGGTDYNQALIDQPCGGLQIAKSGKYKRVIIFLTDGLPNFEPKTSEIIQFAKANQITIYAVTLDMPAPQSIKEITMQTGGQYFENITTQKEAEDTYRKLLQSAQGGDPCEIEWQSNASCIAGITNVELRITNLGIKATTNYQNPITSIAMLEFNPKSLNFKKPVPGKKIDTTITVTAINGNFTISNITVSNFSYILTPTNFNIKSGESINLTLSYLPTDSGYTSCKFELINNICNKKYYASGGFPDKKPKVRTLKLIHPNGGEVFVAGSDTVITWEGVTPDEPVTLEYRIDDNTEWQIITKTATGLSHRVNMPLIVSDKYLMRVTAKASYDDSFIEMVLINAGHFQMGNSGNYQIDPRELPVHKVTISRDFLIGKYEITQKQFDSVMGKNPSFFNGKNLPVEMIQLDDVIEFCNKLSDMEKLEHCYTLIGTSIECNWDANGYRLPTEAEWEYACKAGTSTDIYNGNIENKNCAPIDINLDKISWYCGNSGGYTNEVGKKEPNSFGLYDMIGNVWEMCWGWDDDYTNKDETDPKGEKSENQYSHHHVAKGGSWKFLPRECRSSFRGLFYPSLLYNEIGFRVVRVF